MSNFVFACIALLVVSCATTQDFQKSVNNFDGYSITDRSRKDQFNVKIVGNKKLEKASLEKYMKRAVGEECSARGFSYFDVAWVNDSSASGYCYETHDAVALSLEFKAEPLQENPSRLVVSKINGKGHTRLAPEDELLAVNDKDVKTLDDLKVLERELAERDAALEKEESKKIAEPRAKYPRVAKVTILRLGEKMVVSEPYVHINQGILGPDDLKKLRDEIFWNQK